MKLGQMLVAAAAAGLAAADSNFLRQYKDSKVLFSSLDTRTDTVVRLSNLATPWPLDVPPWVFVERAIRDICTNANATNCWAYEVRVPAMMMLADDEAPRPANVSLVVEGVFDPHKECCSRDNMIRMMAIALQEMHDPLRLEYIQFKVVDPLNNQTAVEFRPLYTAPMAIGVGVGYRLRQRRYFLSLKLTSFSVRPGPPGECEHFKKRFMWRVRARYRSDLSRARRLGLIVCLWRHSAVEPIFPRGYRSRMEAPPAKL